MGRMQNTKRIFKQEGTLKVGVRNGWQMIEVPQNLNAISEMNKTIAVFLGWVVAIGLIALAVFGVITNL